MSDNPYDDPSFVDILGCRGGTWEQRKLYIPQEELEMIAETAAIHERLGMDLQRVYDHPNTTAAARGLRDQLVLLNVLTTYNLVDYIFAEELEIRLNPTKSKHFTQFIIDELFLLKKMSLLQSMVKLPGEVTKAVHRINSLRNVIAHSHRPTERKEAKDGKLLYNGIDIHTIKGLDELNNDVGKIIDCLAIDLVKEREKDAERKRQEENSKPRAIVTIHQENNNDEDLAFKTENRQ